MERSGDSGRTPTTAGSVGLGPEGAFNVTLKSSDTRKLKAAGGAEKACFVVLENELPNYSIRAGDVVLEVEQENVAGYTSSDVQTLFDYCANLNRPIGLTLIHSDALNPDLRTYLNCRFTKGSPEENLQNTIRDNLYIRTVPCTTRSPRAGEVNGVDYHFLSKEDFACLERDGELLESGVFEGNFYGTPLPNITIQGRKSAIKATLLVPGAHPSSEGKRRRNRSNVEAFLNQNKWPMAPSTSGGHLELSNSQDKLNNNGNSAPTQDDSGVNSSSTRGDENHNAINNNNEGENYKDSKHHDIYGDFESTTIVDDELGPLPPQWEKAYTEHGEPYFINLTTNTSQWDDPRLCGGIESVDGQDASQVGSPLEQMEQLPYGWERIDDPQYGTYYIDHINKRTQYESPLVNQPDGSQIISGNTVLNTSGSTLSIAMSSAREEEPHGENGVTFVQSSPSTSLMHGTLVTSNEQQEHQRQHFVSNQHSRSKSDVSAQYAVVRKGGHDNQWSESSTLSRRDDAGSMIDPLYATIGPKKRPEDIYTSMASPTANSLMTTHNYANVYEPQYRMSEGHRHRENGMVSIGAPPEAAEDDLEKINESQATENDSVFTSGGNHELDFSDHDLNEPNNNNNNSNNNNNNNEKPKQSSSKISMNKEDFHKSMLEKNVANEGDGQMNNSRDGILALMPCLASCVQDKTYASLGDFRKPHLNTMEGKNISFVSNEVKKSTDSALSSSKNHSITPTNGKTLDAGSQTKDSSALETETMPLNNAHLAHNDGEPTRKIPPPTLPKPTMLSQVSHQQALLPPQYQLPYVFTRNPAELVGEIVHVSLVKSPRGFGFTIIGGNDHQAEEFLQIRSITPGGPAWSDGKLQTGDVLVHVNGICVLGYTHSDVVSLFQSIVPGEMVHLQICRGYKLPFDPDDPNMEIVTTQAVTANVSMEQGENNESLINRSVVGASQEYQNIYGTVMRKMQNIDLSKGSLGGSATLGQKAALLSSSNVEQHNSLHEESGLDFEPPKYLTVEIVKGTSGFGFTIADSANGQKVKKILDEVRCQDLAEGDILVEINGRDVRARLHSEVVQVLKECQIGSTARVTVQRGGFTTSKSQATGARTPVNGMDDAGSEKGSHASTSFSQFNFNPNPSAMQYRSKTPTADLYGSAKEVVIQRPKTPVVDTRNWECPEKPPRTGPQMMQGMDATDRPNVNNSIYGTTVAQAGPYNQRYDDDLYGHVRAKSEVWHYDYPTPAGQRNLSRNAHSAVASSHGDYANYYALYGNTDRVTPQPSYDHGQQSIYGTTGGYPESMVPSAQGYIPEAYGAEFQVTLSRQESGFGFRIVGGTEEGSQVAIGHIVPGGAADLDGQIQTSDEILSVDGHSVANASHHHVVQLMGAAALSGQVTLGLRRRFTNLHNTSGHSSEVVPGYTYNVTVERHETEGFGFVIISSVGKCGSTIGRIIEGSPAERCGKLQIGDRIHAVNGISILDMHHEDIVNLIKVSGLTVTLTIAPRAGAISAIQDDLSSIGTNRPLGPEDFNERPGSQMLAASSLVEGQMMPPASPGGPAEFRRVVLQRGVRGFGFSIRGGREFRNMPLFVLRIAEMGPAQMSGQLHVGDQILEVNGICTDNMTHAEAINLIRQGGNTVTLLIKRTNQPSHQPLSVESPPSLLSQHSLGGPISQSSPRSPSAMMLHSPPHQQQPIYGSHGGQWIG